MAAIIAIANQKGGVGKTTTTVNLSACVARMGRKVLCVDMDPQGNATSGLGIEKNKPLYSVYNVLVDKVPIKDAIITSVVANLHVVPSRKELAGAEIELVSVVSRETILKEALKEVENLYDYIFIDCPPSLGLLTLNSLTAAHTLLSPIQCEYYALEGISDLMGSVKLVRNRLNPTLDFDGVVLTMFDSRTNLSSQVVSEVKKFFGERVYSTLIPRSVRLGEAPSFGLPVIMYDPRSTGAKAYEALAAEFLSKKEGK
ncbi:MAG: ParA family protein [Clostridia bacterium]|nr:ParA family protein [Clostridia bacterium]